MTNKTNLKPYFNQGISYATYLKNEKELLENKDDFEKRNYHVLNLKRAERMDKVAGKMSPTSNSHRTTEKKMLIISEGWCGDAAQIIPFAAQLALNNEMELRIIYRDQNIELMDEYLTNGGMAIPVIIAVDHEFNYINHFAPRPKEAQNLMLNMKKEGIPKEEINTALQHWYNKDKGEKITQELVDLF